MEYDLIDKIASIAKTSYDPSVIKGIGDDCAVVRPSSGKALALTTDTLVENVHFDLSYFSPYYLGRKTAACNLSDLAAVGAKPKWALLNLAVPPGLAEDFWLVFSKGLFSWFQEWGVTLVGGDTVSSPERLVLGLTLAGEVAPDKWLKRDGARPGDLIFCSGYLGESACGLALLKQKLVSTARTGKKVWQRLIHRHLNPEPRLDLGAALSESGLVTSCIDLSDGLATDLAHVCKASGVQATVYAHQIPVSRALRTACRALGHDPLRLATSGGEDFELLWTSPGEHTRAIQKIAGNLGLRAFCIGKISEGTGVWLKGSFGSREITLQGFEHKM